MERRVVAILFAGVDGYVRLMGRDEAGTLAALKSHRAELIDPKVAAHHGRLVKLMGDGALVEFASVVDAVQCAVEIQRGMAERNTRVPEDRRIEFRVGIYLGDMIVEGEDIYGDGVCIAARISNFARPGGVCISDNIHQIIQTHLDIPFSKIDAPEMARVPLVLRHLWHWSPSSADTAAAVP
jgi:adenylate cyclase